MNFFKGISHFFCTNKALSWLLLSFVLIAGSFGFFSMPQQYNPEVTLPAFTIQTNFTGATADEVDKFVTREMEEKISEIPGVDSIVSQSREGGVSLVWVTFFAGENIEESKVKLFSKIQENLDMTSNDNIANPIIKTITPDDVAVGVWALTSKSISENVLRQKAIEIENRLRSIEGIANIEVTGGNKRALKVLINPQELKERNISLPEIEAALQQNNGRALLGNLRTDTTLHSIEINTSIADVQSAKDIIISDGVTLGDVADIRLGYTEKTSFTTLYNYKQLHEEDAIFISVAKQKGENTSDVMDMVLDDFALLEKEIEFQDVSFQNIRNTAKIANDSIYGLGTNLLQSIGIVSLILFLFLGGRAGFLVALAIPLSLFLVFFLGFIADQTINKITLFALILSLGLLVDSATVVVENIYRHMQMDDEKEGNAIRSKTKRITDAVGEVGTGLFLSTVTSVIVFLPLTQITGMMGPYMGPLAFFVPAALICSLFIAYSITPFLSQYFFSLTPAHSSLFPKRTSSQNISLKSGQKVPLAKIEVKISLFEKIQNKYASLLSSVLDSKKKQNFLLLFVFGGLILSFLLVPFQMVHFQILPKSDNKTIWITLDLQEGASSILTQEVALEIEQELSNIQYIENVALFTGVSPIVDFNGLFRNFSHRTAENQSSILVSFADEKEKSSESMAAEIREKIKYLELQHNAVIRVVEDPPGPPVSSTVVVKVVSEHPQARTRMAQWTEKQLRAIEGVVDIDSSLEYLYPRSTFIIDHQKAKENKVSAYEIFQTLRLAVSPHIIGSFSVRNSTEQSVIEFSLPKDMRQKTSDLSSIFVKNLAGQMVPISSVVKIHTGFSEHSLQRDDNRDFVQVFAEMQERSMVYAIIDFLWKAKSEFEIESFSLYGIDIREKESNEIVRLEWGGEGEMTLDNFRDLLIGMGIALALVYAILVGRFKSFIIPLLIMATIPLALLGILPGFALLDMINGTLLTATALIGFIALMGIVVNNSIIYMEYLNILRSKGVDLKTALVETGKTRLRPILLTSVTTILGSLTIAADPVWSGLAWSIVFGLSLSSLLTLGIFPILYWKNQKDSD